MLKKCMQLMLSLRLRAFLHFPLFQDDANWKQYAVHAPDVPVQKESSQPLDNIHHCLIKFMCNFFNATSFEQQGAVTPRE